MIHLPCHSLPLPVDWHVEIVAQLHAAASRGLMIQSECASFWMRLVDWTRKHLVARNNHVMTGVIELVHAIVSHTHYMLHQHDALSQLYPYEAADPLIEQWVDWGARVDPRILLTWLVPANRCTRIYERLLQVGPNFARSTNPETNLFAQAVKSGNLAMINVLAAWGARPCIFIKAHCLSILYTMECSNPHDMLTRWHQLGWLDNVEIPYNLQHFFWQRACDEYKANWLSLLWDKGITCLVPNEYAVIGPMTRRVLDDQALYRRSRLLALIAGDE